MSYQTWFENHGKKHKKIVDKLKHLSDEELIEYFRWENMVQNEVWFCSLYKENKKCHNTENLNCYLCACPNFRFDDGAKKLKSRCDINSKDGKQITSKSGVIHQDCSGCLIPHDEEFIKRNFSRDWFEVMAKVKP